MHPFLPSVSSLLDLATLDLKATYTITMYPYCTMLEKLRNWVVAKGKVNICKLRRPEKGRSLPHGKVLLFFMFFWTA